MNNIIEINNLEKSYNKKKIKVIDKVNYKFKNGKIYSLIGPSGSGKSTLLNLLSLIDIPNSGTILINNQKINFKEKNKNDQIRSSKIGIIYQDKNLLSDFTVLENVYLPRLAISNNKIDAIKDSKNLLKKFFLLKRQNHFTSELSGGEMQRVAIARALINTPSIVLADEPTGNLDFKNAKIVFKTLFKLRSKNRLIIYATHNRYFANLADCKIELFNGKIKTISNVRKK
jgi:ABC-type lipoprotein export system ATPase subunit